MIAVSRGRTLQPREIAAGFPSAAIRYCMDNARHHAFRDLTSRDSAQSMEARLGTKPLMYALKMRALPRERAKVLARFVGIPTRLATGL